LEGLSKADLLVFGDTAGQAVLGVYVQGVASECGLAEVQRRTVFGLLFERPDSLRYLVDEGLKTTNVLLELVQAMLNWPHFSPIELTEHLDHVFFRHLRLKLPV